MYTVFVCTLNKKQAAALVQILKSFSASPHKIMRTLHPFQKPDAVQRDGDLISVKFIHWQKMKFNNWNLNCTPFYRTTCQAQQALKAEPSDQWWLPGVNWLTPFIHYLPSVQLFNALTIYLYLSEVDTDLIIQIIRKVWHWLTLARRTWNLQILSLLYSTSLYICERTPVEMPAHHPHEAGWLQHRQACCGISTVKCRSQATWSRGSPASRHNKNQKLTWLIEICRLDISFPSLEKLPTCPGFFPSANISAPQANGSAVRLSPHNILIKAGMEHQQFLQLFDSVEGLGFHILKGQVLL